MSELLPVMKQEQESHLSAPPTRLEGCVLMYVARDLLMNEGVRTSWFLGSEK